MKTEIKSVREAYKTIMNPSTGKMVQSGGNLGKKIIKDYKSETIYNPVTRKQVKTSGLVGRKVLKTYMMGGSGVTYILKKQNTDSSTNTYKIIENGEEKGIVEVKLISFLSRGVSAQHNSKFEYTLRYNNDDQPFIKHFENNNDENLKKLYELYKQNRQQLTNKSPPPKTHADPSDEEKFYLDVYIYFKYFVKLKEYDTVNDVTPSTCKENTQKFLKSNKCKVWNYTGRRQWNPKLVKGLTKIINEHKNIELLKQQEQQLLFNDKFLNNSKTWKVLETAYKNGENLWGTYKSNYIENKYSSIKYTIEKDKKTVSLKIYKINGENDEYYMENTNHPKIIYGFVKKKLHKKGGYTFIIDFNDKNQRYSFQSFNEIENRCMEEQECTITGIDIVIIKNRKVKVKNQTENIFEPVDL